MQSACHDPWHYTGNSDFHKSDKGAELMALIKERLMKIDIPVTIGSTGYPSISAPIAGYGWGLDPHGRMVALIENTLIFQRMNQGTVLMCGLTDKGERAVFADWITGEMYDEFMEKVRAYSI